MKKNDLRKGEIIMYKTSKNEVELKVHFEKESVWLRQNEIALLFGKERSVITKHINKIFADKEVDRKSNVQKMHIPNSDKPIEFYSLDVILAVGYKASHLLYLTIKDHPFTDGNKRIASFLFVFFLERSSYLFKKSGERKINDNALTALALLVAVSDPKDKEVMIKIIKNLISE